MSRWFKKYSEYDYPLLAMMVINSSEESAIGKIIESLPKEDLHILLTQMSHFASMSYQDLIEKYGNPPNEGDPFIAILGTEEIKVRGQMKRFISGPWILMSLIDYEEEVE